jgi:hypothetical protein
VTEHLVTEHLATECLVTECLGTERSATERRATECRATERLATECLGTQHLVTQCLVTERLATECLVTERLATERLATEHLATECLVTECLVTECLGTLRLRTQRLATQCLAAERLVTERLATERLVTERLVTECLATDRSSSPLIYIIFFQPSRELAEQTFNQLKLFKAHLGSPPVRELLVVGGVKVDDQIRALEAGVDIVVATPGRLEDLIQKGSLSLTQCRFFILDEADGLLKAGYENLINRIHSAIPKMTSDGSRLQMVVCSATLHAFEVKKLADRLMHFPTWVDLKGQDSVPDTVHHVVVPVDPRYVKKNFNLNSNRFKKIFKIFKKVLKNIQKKFEKIRKKIHIKFEKMLIKSLKILEKQDR